MDAIANADGRFDYVGDESMVYDIKFDDGTNQLMLAGLYWMYNINGGMAWYGYTEQAVYNGDFVKFGDESCGTYIAPWTQVWETPVTPVSVYNTSVVENSVDMTLYPNPAYDKVFIEAEGILRIRMFDIQGQCLMEQNFDRCDRVEMPLTSLVPKLYLLEIQTELGVARRKLTTE